MHLYRFLLGTLCVWRVTICLMWKMDRGISSSACACRFGDGFFGQLLDCFYCLSVWIAAPLSYFLGDKLNERILLWPALSAGAILARACH